VISRKTLLSLAGGAMALSACSGSPSGAAQQPINPNQSSLASNQSTLTTASQSLRAPVGANVKVRSTISRAPYSALEAKAIGGDLASFAAIENARKPGSIPKGSIIYRSASTGRAASTKNEQLYDIRVLPPGSAVPTNAVDRYTVQ